jgi:hypothetical protein
LKNSQHQPFGVARKRQVKVLKKKVSMIVLSLATLKAPLVNQIVC